MADGVVIKAGIFAEIFSFETLEHGITGAVLAGHEKTFGFGVDVGLG